MFSINEDFNLSDDEINFSILQTPVISAASCQNANRSSKSEKERYPKKTTSAAQDNNYETPKSKSFKFVRRPTLQKSTFHSKSTLAVDNNHETPKPKRFKFVKTSALQKSTCEKPAVTKTEAGKETIDNLEDFFGNDSEEDDLLSQIEIPEKVTSLKSYTPQNKFVQANKTLGTVNEDEVNTYCNSTNSKTSEHLEAANKTPLYKMISKPVVTPRSQRKFPGPAGILPQLSTYKELKTLKSPEISKERRPLTPQTPKTPLQNIVNLTEENDVCSDVWVEMNALLQRKFPNETVESIKNILEKASHRKLDKCKVPLMCGVIKSSSIKGNSGKLILNDNTGDIHGAVHSEILEECQNGLQRGSGLILKDTSVFSPTVKKHYLNITPSNIVAFFEREIPEEPLTQVTQLNTSRNRTILLDSGD